jgi:hypothetical protein
MSEARDWDGYWVLDIGDWVLGLMAGALVTQVAELSLGRGIASAPGLVTIEADLYPIHKE